MHTLQRKKNLDYPPESLTSSGIVYNGSSPLYDEMVDYCYIVEPKPMNQTSKPDTADLLENNSLYIGKHYTKLEPSLESNAINMCIRFGISNSD